MNNKKLKEIKKTFRNNVNKNKAKSTQRYLQFAGAKDSTLILKDGGIRAVLEVSSVNFNLKSDDEKEAIIGSYQRFLNALSFPVQILLRSQKLDIDHYLNDLVEKRKRLENQLLKDQMSEYIEYIRKLVEYSDIMEKRFFVVIPMDPGRAEKGNLFTKFLAYIRPDDTVLEIIKRKKEFKELKKTLDGRVNIVQTSLENCGLKTNKLNTQEIIELFYRSYNPQAARTQKIQRIEDLSISGGPEDNLTED